MHIKIMWHTRNFSIATTFLKVVYYYDKKLSAKSMYTAMENIVRKGEITSN